MTHLSMDPLTLGHTAITLVAIAAGLWVFAQLLKNVYCRNATAVFLLFTVLTSATGFLFQQSGAQPTPAQVIGAISLVLLAVALYALYSRKLAGLWRPVYVITALISLWFNVFVLVIQSFIKIPPLHALAPSIPPSGPVFGAVQGVVLIAFVVGGWLSVKRFRPLAV